MSYKNITVTDEDGSTLNMAEFRGRPFPPLKEPGLVHATKIEARPDDTLITAFPKSGTHWLFQILRCLAAESVDLPIKEKEVSMIELHDPSHTDNLPSPRILNTHFHAEELSPDFMAKKCKIIHMTRDPRDIIVSDYHHHVKLTMVYKYSGKFKNFFRLFLESKVDYGSWFDHTKGWEKAIQENKDVPILVLSYESMKTNPLENIRKISEFMGFDRSEDFLKKVVDKTSIETMQKDRINYGMFKGKLMYRKGIIGDWKNMFTVTQSEMFNEVFEREMAGTLAYKLYSHKGENR